MNLIFNKKIINKLKWNILGLIPVITQEIYSNNILMFAWMNKEALIKTLLTNNAVYWSRSRNKIWLKGENSGYYQRIYQIFIDCDKDTILLKVVQICKITCHTGNYSCFFLKLI